MVELIKLFIKQPVLAIVSGLAVVVLYITLSLFTVQESVAGLQVQASSYATTEGRLYTMSASLGRIEAHLENLRKDK
tara:strand:- start:1081 stop:1311 length:231 start_codon:yes stop_codon:yes gene_type:complete